MWNVDGNNLRVTEEDFGVALRCRFTGIELTSNDVLKFTFKNKPNGSVILTKEFTNLESNTFDLVFTSEDMQSLPIGSYTFTVDWYQEGLFRYCLIEKATLKVGDKA